MTRVTSVATVLCALATLAACSKNSASPAAAAGGPDPLMDNARRMIDEGRLTFRYDTFGDEAFWGGSLRLHHLIAGKDLGGAGAGVSAEMAMKLGFKVDVHALPDDVFNALAAGKLDLKSPATTVALLKHDAVVGLSGFFDDKGTLVSLGVTCALCHSTVDDSFAPGVGERMDGWPNRDLNLGAVLAAAPDIKPISSMFGGNDKAVRAALKAWGPGRFDAVLFLDGKTARPDGKTSAVLIPAIYGLGGVDGHTYSGSASMSYWNALVANVIMHGSGTFFDPRLDDAQRFPLAAATRAGHTATDDDRITGKLGSLQFYQLALEVPMPAAGSFDAAAAERGKALFASKGRCTSCHVPPLYTEPGYNRHTPAEIGIDDFEAKRMSSGRYRTMPLRGVSARAKGGYYHDGRFASLADVVQHYDGIWKLGLTPAEKTDLVEFLKSL